MIQETVVDAPLSSGEVESTHQDREGNLKSIQRFYKLGLQTLDYSDPPFPEQQIGFRLYKESSEYLMHTLKSSVETDIETGLQLFVKVMSKIQHAAPQGCPALVHLLQKLLWDAGEEKAAAVKFPTLYALIGLMVASAVNSGSGLSKGEIDGLQYRVLSHLWTHLTPSNARYHVEAARCVWQFQGLSNQHRRPIESGISSLMLSDGVSNDYALDAQRKFGILWTHSMQPHANEAEFLYANDAKDDTALNALRPSSSAMSRKHETKLVDDKLVARLTNDR
ncbi:MAG: hypothetical protein M1826_003627 [Phylliscum demangeonii]|nr:MAG: hypothetical protein M1826_003627 [Phylliscum demangeonii]